MALMRYEMWAGKGGGREERGRVNGKYPRRMNPPGSIESHISRACMTVFLFFRLFFLQALARLFLHHVYWHVKLLAGGVQKEDRGILAFLRGVGRDLDLLLGSAAWNTFLANHYWHLRKLFLFVWGACVLRLVAFVE